MAGTESPTPVSDHATNSTERVFTPGWNETPLGRLGIPPCWSIPTTGIFGHRGMER